MKKNKRTRRMNDWADSARATGAGFGKPRKACLCESRQALYVRDPVEESTIGKLDNMMHNAGGHNLADGFVVLRTSIV